MEVGSISVGLKIYHQEYERKACFWGRINVFGGLRLCDLLGFGLCNQLLRAVYGSVDLELIVDFCWLWMYGDAVFWESVFGYRSEPQRPALYTGIRLHLFLALYKSRTQHFPVFTVSSFQSSKTRATPGRKVLLCSLGSASPAVHVGILPLLMLRLTPCTASIRGFDTGMEHGVVLASECLCLPELKGKRTQHPQRGVSYEPVTQGRRDCRHVVRSFSGTLHVIHVSPTVEEEYGSSGSQVPFPCRRSSGCF